WTTSSLSAVRQLRHLELTGHRQQHSRAIGLVTFEGRGEQLTGGQAAVGPACVGDRDDLLLARQVVELVFALHGLRSAWSPGNTTSSRCRPMGSAPAPVP